MKSFKPFPGFIVIEPEPKSNTAGDFILSEGSQEKTFFGKVRAVGKQRKDEEIICEVGDRVLFNKWASNELTIDGKKYQFLRANEILAIVPENAKSN